MPKERHVAQSEGLLFLHGPDGWDWGTKGMKRHIERCLDEMTGHFMSTDFEIEAITTTVVPIIGGDGSTNRVAIVVNVVGVNEI